MKPDGRLKLVSQLLDLPLLDSEGKYCGVVDDVELSGGAGKALKLEALLVGPGAYEGRLPGWAMWLVRKVAGTHVARVPLAEIKSIGSMVNLNCPAKDVGLGGSEAAAARLLPHKGAL